MISNLDFIEEMYEVENEFDEVLEMSFGGLSNKYFKQIRPYMDDARRYAKEIIQDKFSYFSEYIGNQNIVLFVNKYMPIDHLIIACGDGFEPYAMNGLTIESDSHKLKEALKENNCPESKLPSTEDLKEVGRDALRNARNV